MKKIIFLIAFITLFTVGCSNVKTDNIDNIINKKITLNYQNKVFNVHHRGYKYYLPKKMSVERINDTNEIVTSDNYTYYLYLDLISVLENTEIPFVEENLYKKIKFNYKDINGYLKIKKLNKNYLVEIMYNYAKIEVIVEENDLNEVINNSITILSTIKYNKDIIKNLMEENLLNYKDESLNLFDKKNNSKDNFIKYEEQYDSYEETIPDYDVIN